MMWRTGYSYRWMGRPYLLLPAITVPLQRRDHRMEAGLARWTLESAVREPLGRIALIELLEEIGDTLLAWSRTSDAEILARIERAIESGRLMVLRADEGSSESRQATSRENAVAKAAMCGTPEISFEGQKLRLVPAHEWEKLRERRDLQLVSRERAIELLDRLAAAPTTHAVRKKALIEAKSLLVDRAAPDKPRGIVLARRIPLAAIAPANSAAPLTPSQLRGQDPPKSKGDIAVTFVEKESGRPLADAAFIFQKPDGSEVRLLTGSDGMAKLTDLDPGVCVVTSVIKNATIAASFAAHGGPAGPSPANKPNSESIRPAYLVDAVAHRVKSDETPDSIAADAGVPWADIAQFNWETSDPEALQSSFRDQVGCTKKTPDGKRYLFDDADDPGVVMIPKPWTASFAIGGTYTVLVESERAVYLSLENEAGLLLPGAGYEVTFADGSVERGALGRSGIARLAGVPEGPYSVSYPEADDLLARSLAASTRRAFDQQATGPLFFLLGQTQKVIDRAIGVYNESFNDLTGKGLAADIDQVVTDPDARPPLVFLCTLAGLSIEGAVGATVQDGMGEAAGGG